MNDVRRRVASVASLLVVALSWLIPAAAIAAPVAEADRVNIDLRRTTLIVADIDNSLRFYRDALGMVVIYDNMIRTPRSAQTDAEAEVSRRLVFLRANDDYVGIVGLLEYTKPLSPVRAPEPEDFSIGSSVLLFNTDDLANRFAAAAAVPGAAVLTEPTDVTYPAYGDGDPIEVRVSILRDPDGFLVELNQLLSEPDNAGR